MNKKGFTLTELLAVIVIIGIVSTVAVVSISKLKTKFNDNYYITIKNNISLAARDYSIDNRSAITKEGLKIDITTFVEKGYIKEVKDIKKENCKGYVVIKRKGISVDTKVCLICDNYKSEDC